MAFGLAMAARRQPTVVGPGSDFLEPHNLNRTGRGPIARPYGTITRDEWLAKEYFGYLCGK